MLLGNSYLSLWPRIRNVTAMETSKILRVCRAHRWFCFWLLSLCPFLFFVQSLNKGFPEFGVVNQRGKWTPWSDTLKKELSLLQSKWGIGNQGEIDGQNYQCCVRSSSCLEIGLSPFVMAWDIVFSGQLKAKGVQKSYKDFCGIRINKRTIEEGKKNEKKKRNTDLAL